MRIKIKAPQHNSRTTFRQSEIDRMKEVIRHQQIRIRELETVLKVQDIDKDDEHVKATHLAIRSVFPYYQPEFIKVKARKREVLELRQIFIWILRHKTSLSLQKIGQICGGRDHSTVINSCRVVDNLMSYDKRYARNLETVKNKFEEFAEQI
jgi:chromosomal replication initiation ATPase DnaA